MFVGRFVEEERGRRTEIRTEKRFECSALEKLLDMTEEVSELEKGGVIGQRRGS